MHSVLAQLKPVRGKAKAGAAVANDPKIELIAQAKALAKGNKELLAVLTQLEELLGEESGEAAPRTPEEELADASPAGLM
jgi:hypothetical protein